MYLNVLNKRVNLPNQRCNLNILLLVLTVRQVNLLIYDIQYYFLMYTTVPFLWAPLDDSAGKNLPMQETQVQSLGWEDALEKEVATHSSILPWELPWTEECGGV